MERHNCPSIPSNWQTNSDFIKIYIDSYININFQLMKTFCEFFELLQVAVVLL